MSVRPLILGLAAATALAVLTQATAAPQPLKVTSTLDGKTVLPHHLRWIGSAGSSASEITKVDFLIDGKLHWSETKPPYVYAGNGPGAHRGYLVTSWLAPGKHAFTVKVYTSSGQTAVDAVVARVLPAPEVPHALAGTWQRTLGKPVPADPGATGVQPNPAGTYKITFSRQFIQDHYPGVYNASNTMLYGAIIDDDYVPGPTTFKVWGGVQFQPEMSWAAEGGWWCDSDGPAATYTWSVSGDTLTLAPVGGKDGCRQRGTTWTGTWTRVK
jgi:hypothetical protein